MADLVDVVILIKSLTRPYVKHYYGRVSPEHYDLVYMLHKQSSTNYVSVPTAVHEDGIRAKTFFSHLIGEHDAHLRSDVQLLHGAFKEVDMFDDTVDYPECRVVHYNL